jgi:hypothetical protein
MMRHSFLIAFLIYITAISGCDEPFPSMKQPENVLSVETAVKVPDTVSCYQDNTTGGWYFNDQLIIIIRAINKYDDLLQGEASIEGHADLQAFGTVSRIVVVPFSLGALRKPPVFANNIALAPDSAAEFQILWLPIGSDNMPVWYGSPSVTLSNGTKLYGPIEFLLSGEVRLFARIQSLKFSGMRFSMYFKMSSNTP